MATRDPRAQRELRTPTTRARRRSALSMEHHARLARRLTPRDRWLIRMLHEHHVLTTTAIAAMAFPSVRSARQRLLELYGWNVLDRFQPLIGHGSAFMHYVLGAGGAAVLAAEEGVTTRDLGYRRDDVLAIAHRHTLAHTVAINDVFAHLVRHCVATGEFRLVQWWSETRCARHVGDLARPDSYGRLTVPASGRGAPVAGRPPGQRRVFEWFFELDFGTEPLSRLAGKLDGYAQLAAATGVAVPVLIWLPSPGREATAREHLGHALRRLDRPDLVPVATTTPHAGLYSDPGPGGAGASPGGHGEGEAYSADMGWLPLDSDRLQAAPFRTGPNTAPSSTRAQGPRCGLAGLAALWPAPAEHTHTPLVAPGTGRTGGNDRTPRGRTGIVELPAPDPIPPDTDTFNPATRDRATRPAAIRDAGGPDRRHPDRGSP